MIKRREMREIDPEEETGGDLIKKREMREIDQEI